MGVSIVCTVYVLVNCVWVVRDCLVFSLLCESVLEMEWKMERQRKRDKESCAGKGAIRAIR